MIEELKPYPGYKDSGLPWCPRIPSHWDLKPNRALVRQRKVLVGERHSKYTLLSLTKRGVIVRDLSGQKGKHSADMSTFQEVHPGDLVMCLFDVPETPRTIGRSDHFGMITGAYTVFEANDRITAKWLEAFYIAMDDRKLLSPLYSGLRNTIPRPKFLGIKTPYPTPDEQFRIVEIIGYLNKKVNSFILNRRRLIEVLNEQKQGIINRTVTRGLEPDVRLKPSGIDWLGDIPKHWNVISLRQLGRFSKGSGGSREDDVAEGVPCIRYGHLYMYFNFTVSAVRTYLSERRACDYARIKYGDILFTASGEDMSEIGKSVVNLIEEEVCCGGDVIILRPRIVAHAPFLGYASDAWHARCQKARLGRGTTVKHIYGDQLKKVCIAVPPMDEQVAIAEHIQLATSEATSLINRAQREINLIREYRTRLITDVVTGKIDVRHLAPPPGNEDLEETFEALEPLEDVIDDVEMDEEEEVNESD